MERCKYYLYKNVFEIYNVCCMSVYLDSATLAQSVERFTRNEKVAGSIPAGGLN